MYARTSKPQEGFTCKDSHAKCFKTTNSTAKHYRGATMAVRTTGAGGARAPLTSKAGGLSPPKKDLSVPKLIHVFNGLQCYTCINPMIMVKLTSKGQKSMFEHVKNRKKFLGGRVPGPPSSTCVFIARRAPLTFFIFLRPWERLYRGEVLRACFRHFLLCSYF